MDPRFQVATFTAEALRAQAKREQGKCKRGSGNFVLVESHNVKKSRRQSKLRNVLKQEYRQRNPAGKTFVVLDIVSIIGVKPLGAEVKSVKIWYPKNQAGDAKDDAGDADSFWVVASIGGILLIEQPTFSEGYGKKGPIRHHVK